MKRQGLQAEALSAVARRLVAPLPDSPVVLDVGCGAGAMSVPLAAALREHGGGVLVLVDAPPALLDAGCYAAAQPRGAVPRPRPPPPQPPPRAPPRAACRSRRRRLGQAGAGGPVRGRP